jgi:hypothetical protein
MARARTVPLIAMAVRIAGPIKYCAFMLNPSLMNAFVIQNALAVTSASIALGLSKQTFVSHTIHFPPMDSTPVGAVIIS